MFIVGCDYHPQWQQVAWLDTETGETGERKLMNGEGEAERWYGQLPVPSLIGLEATGNSQWFVDRLRQGPMQVARRQAATTMSRGKTRTFENCSHDGCHFNNFSRFSRTLTPRSRPTANNP